MEFRSISGKKFILQKNHQQIPDVIAILKGDNYIGKRILPDGISDDLYGDLFKFFNSGKIRKLSSDFTDALDYFGYEVPEYDLEMHLKNKWKIQKLKKENLRLNSLINNQ